MWNTFLGSIYKLFIMFFNVTLYSQQTALYFKSGSLFHRLQGEEEMKIKLGKML